VRRPLVLVLLALGVAACGSSAPAPTAKPTEVAFGRGGGNILPQRFVVSAHGRLAAQVRAAFGGLTSRQCPGTLPDLATEYIRFEGRTVRVHGNCEPAFSRLWNALSASRS